MISNERRWPAQRQPYPQPYYQRPFSAPPRPFVQEDTLNSGRLQIERKHFSVALKENPRGRFLRITEEVSGRHNSIIIPSTGLAEFQKMLDEMVNAANEIPAIGQPPQP